MSVVILVVEDNTATRKMMRLTLQAEAYTVLEAEDGEGALRLVKEQAPALVLLDCKLPDMDGFEVGRRLRTLAPRTPVIAITGWAQADEARVLAAGFLDMLLKPVEPSRLIEIVERHVGHAPVPLPHLGRTLLLAEDDLAQRKLAQLALSRAGFAVTVAEDGEAACRLAAAQKPDIIVSDILMPRMDGFALCKTIRSDPKLARVPIVLMSAYYLEEEDRELAARFGANRYVSRTGGFDAVVRAALEAIDAPVEQLAATDLDDLDVLQTEHLRRVARQLERQASISVGLARRVSLQASALSVLDSLSDSLSRQLDPENALDDTLDRCLDAAGLSVGAVFLHADAHGLTLKAQVGSKDVQNWGKHSPILLHAIDQGGIMIPSSEAGETGNQLLAALGAASAIIVPILARDEALGALLLASSDTDLAGTQGDSAVRAARSVSTQLGQALALSRMFSKVASDEQRYRGLFESARDAIAILTPEGIILEANHGWEEILAAPRVQIVGHHFSDFAVDGGQVALRSKFETAPAQGHGEVSTIALQPAGGGVVQVELSRTVVGAGNDRYILGIGRNVTERLRLEEQLRQAQKMEAVGRLAGGIAHDFNNVLSVILSYGESMLAELKSGDPSRSDLQEICKAGQRASDLTRQLLMFSRQQVMEPKVLDLNDVLLGVDKMLQRILGADVDLLSIPAPQLGRIRVDPGSMEQVIMNLVVNARDAMPTGGKLTMETANIFLDQSYAHKHHGVQPGPYVMLAVTDTGVGMDVATQARIFEPFFTTKGLVKGTGLGLSTVFGIIQQSGGSIWVYSEPGVGTTFKVYLPRVQDTIDPIPATRHPSMSRGSETILLVEDDDQVRVVARSILRRNGYRVIEARDAGEALLHSETHHDKIDLLLTDVVMPQMSGPELARQLAGGRPDMKVLCMSGYTDDSILRHGVLAAHIAYLQKPLTPDALSRRVREVLDTTASKTAS
jgi:PAS domain S-box-containing protein